MTLATLQIIRRIFTLERNVNSIARRRQAAIMVTLAVSGLVGDRFSALGQVVTRQEPLYATLSLQLGHTDFVTAVAFSSDGRLVLTGSRDRSARLWATETGYLVRLFRHFGEIKSVAISPDAQYVLTNDGTAHLIATATGKEVRQFASPSSTTRTAVFSHDGRSVLTAGEDKATRHGSVHLWDTETGREVREFDTQQGKVPAYESYAFNSAAFSADGQFIVTGGEDGLARLWEVSSGHELREFSGHSKRITSVAFSSDSTHFATASIDGAVLLWEVMSGEPIARYVDSSNFAGYPRRPEDEGYHQVTPITKKSFGTEVYSVAFSPEDKYLLIGDVSRSVHLLQIKTGAEVRHFESKNTTRMNSVAFSPDGKYVLATFGANASCLWETETGREVREFAGHSSEVMAIAVSPDGRYVLTARRDGVVCLWDKETGRVLRQFGKHQDSPYFTMSVAFSPDGKYVLIGGSSSGDLDNCHTIHLWDAETGKVIREYRASLFSSPPSSVAFSPDGKYVAAVAHGDTAYLWETETGREVRRFWNNLKTFLCVAFSRDGKYVLTAGEDQAVRLWDAKTGGEVRQYKGTSLSSSATFSPDGRYVLAGDIDGRAHLWDTATAREVRQFGPETLQNTSLDFAVAFSPDGRYVVTGGFDTKARLWETETGREVRQFEGHTDQISAVAFSLKDDLLVTGSKDGTTRLWKLEGGKDLCSLTSYLNDNWVVAAPDGRFDTNSLERIEDLHWVMPDDPLTALPVEIFMRPYYQPRLLPRLLAEEDFGETPSLAELNRVQPKVSITDVNKDGSDTAAVTVEVENVERTYQRQKDRVVESGAKDLRLFRDGQLVSYRDGNLLGQTQSATTGCAPVTGSAKKCRAVFEHVRLPRQEGVNDVELSAHAFNTSDVKSETFRFPFKFTPELAARKGRVYLITVGVSKYENSAWNLEFAANDAHLVNETVAAKLRAAKDYDDVVEVMLTSEERMVNGQKTEEKSATKENFRKILRLLAGDKLNSAETREVPNAQKIERATPEDVVLIFYSSHGYRDEKRFYLFPYDTGPGQGRDPEAVVPHSLSSDDLYQWLRDIDAGDMVLVIDACHAAAVTGKAFKPGPMGSHGMGQLAYDKGMRILAATQPDTTAAEVNDIGQERKIQHGLLTYALVADGLTDGRADSDGDKIILLSEWLEYAVTDVPKLYEEAAKNWKGGTAQAQNLQRGSNQVRFISKGEGDTSAQQPSLFDFADKLRRKRHLPVDRISTAAH